MKTIHALFPTLTASILLASCGGGGSTAPSSPEIVTPPPPVMQTVPNLAQNKLLTDAEMVTSAINPAPVVAAASREWAEANHYPIRSVIYDEDFSDLEFLDRLIGDRSIVQLGESSHGTAEFNHLKTRIIKYLHQNKGFNVIAFESGFAEAHYADGISDTGSADELMRFIFPVWHTDEVLELFRYIGETQSTENPLRITGFDIQMSSTVYHARLENHVDGLPASDLVTPAFKSTTNGRLRTFRDLMGDFFSQSCFSGASAACNDISADMLTHIGRLVDTADQIAAVENPSRDLVVLDIALRAASEQLRFSREHLQNGRDPAGELRDREMAGVFDRVRTEIFPGEKIIVWAHNEHIRHAETAQTSSAGTTANILQSPFGSYLHATLPDELYTIGLFMIRGRTANNDGTPLPVVAPLNNSLEAIAHSVRIAALLIESRDDQDRAEGNEFLFESTLSHIWGGSFGAYSSIPSDQYDAMIFIDRSSIPAYRR